MQEQTIATRAGFEGRLLNVEVLDVRLPDGGRSTREIVRHPGAVVVLPRLPDGRFVFVRQFRKPVETVLLEAVAGTLDPGETPETCARRELLEETGYRATELVSLGRMVPAPGYTSEILHAFYARTAPDAGATSTDHDENIECVTLACDEFERRLDAGDVIDAKTLAVWLLWSRRREILP